MYNSKKGKRLYKFLQEKEEIFSYHLKELQLQINENDTHILRKSIKNFKPIFQLIEVLDPSFKASHHFKPLKTIFKPAGDLREIQVNRKTLFNLCPECEIIELYTIYSQKLIQQSTAELKLAVKTFKIKKHQKSLKEIKLIAQELSGKDLKHNSFAYINSKLQLIDQFLQQEKSEENVHEIRIYLKQISAIIILLGKLNHRAFSEELYTIFKNTEDEIGIWHDMIRLRDTIADLKVSTPLEKQELSKMQYTISRKNDVFITSFEKLIQPPIDALKKAMSTR
jgi:hypothetical protein